MSLLRRLFRDRILGRSNFWGWVGSISLSDFGGGALLPNFISNEHIHVGTQICDVIEDFGLNLLLRDTSCTEEQLERSGMGTMPFLHSECES